MIPKKEEKFIINTIHHFFPKATIYFFGSRIQGKPKTYSDLDVCVDDGVVLPLNEWAKLEEEFSKSDLLYKIDLVDFHRIKPDFQKIILKRGIKL